MKKTLISILSGISLIMIISEMNYQTAISKAIQVDTDGEIQAVMQEYGFKNATGTPSDNFSFLDKLKAL